MEFTKKVVLQNGKEFYGTPFGASGDAMAELFCNTSMTGYQEIISNPFYLSKIVMMTYPVIGNYGITDDDFESRQITASALIVRDYNDMPSNFRYTKTLNDLLEENGVPAIQNVDTRSISRIIREEGSMVAAIVSSELPTHEAVAAMQYYKSPSNSVDKISCKKKWYSKTSNRSFNLVVIDCGISLSQIRALNSRGCNLTIVPYNTSADEILGLKPDGVVVSGGPGNPYDILCVADTIKALAGNTVIFGIGLGELLIGIAFGAKAYKMNCGHNGGNHPVKNIESGYIDVYSQTHNYSLDRASLSGTGLKETYVNILDNTVEGISSENGKIFAVEFSPNTDPGPFGELDFYDKLLNLIGGGKNA